MSLLKFPVIITSYFLSNLFFGNSNSLVTSPSEESINNPSELLISVAATGVIKISSTCFRDFNLLSRFLLIRSSKSINLPKRGIQKYLSGII